MNNELDLTTAISRKLIQMTRAPKEFQHEMSERFDSLRQRLAGEHDDPVMEILGERLALAWLQAGFEDGETVEALDRKNTYDAAQHTSRGDQAQRRMVELARTVAIIRRKAPTPDEE